MTAGARNKDAFAVSNPVRLPALPLPDQQQTAVFSLSVPVKGGIEYLETTFASAALQDGLIELALLDASAGDPRVRSLAEKYAALISYRSHRNADAGQSAAIQEGWNNTRGPFLGWLNADDYLLPGALARVKAVFDADPSVDVVYGHAIYVNENGDFQRYFPSISADISDLDASDIICQPACFVRRSAVERAGGLNLALDYTMDWDLWLRLRKLGCKFHMLEDPLAVVCDRADSKTNTGGKARYREIVRCLSKNKNLALRWRARVGFKLYDLLHRATPLSLFVAHAIRAFGWFASLACVRRPLPPLFGLSRDSNRIGGQCRITMAWFGAMPARTALMIVDRPGDYYISDAQGRRLWTLVGPQKVKTFGFNGTGVLYKAEVSAVPGTRIDYVIEVASRPCRLLGFSLR